MQSFAPDTAGSDAVAAWMFLRSLKTSRLLSAPDVEALEEEISHNGLAVVQSKLVADGVLTPYQLRQIAQGSPSSLALGQYRVLDELGQGGFGRVFKAYHVLIDRVVALKVIAPHRSQDPFVRDLFLREMTAGTRLSHPNLALVYDANEAEGTLFFAMEFVNGTSLESHVIDNGPLPIDLARELLVQSAKALQAIHESGLVHRDIKPANLLLTKDGLTADGLSTTTPWIKVVDFGLARLSTPANGQSPGTLLCGDGALVGTPEFMSPEQARDVHTVDIRSDLYSLGCTTYFALTGRPPFVEKTPQEICLMHLTQESTPVQTFRADVPEDLAATLHRLLAKDPADRIQTPSELISILSAISFKSDVAALVPLPPVSPPPNGPSTVDTDTCDITFPIVLTRDIPASEPSNQTIHQNGSLRAAATPDQLRTAWSSWYQILAHSRDPGRCQVRNDEYKAAHRTLIHTIRTTGDWQGAKGVSRDRLLAVVEPWVSLASLYDLDRTTHTTLWATCTQLDAGLYPDRGRSSIGFLVSSVIALGIILLLVAALNSAILGSS